LDAHAYKDTIEPRDTLKESLPPALADSVK
jgi:hypothetical protein